MTQPIPSTVRFLKGEIKAASAYSVAIRKEERKQLHHVRYLRNEDTPDSDTIIIEDEIRFQLWKKRAVRIRHTTRALLLAYACVRGRKFPETKFPEKTKFWKRLLTDVIQILHEVGGMSKKDARNFLKEWLQTIGYETNVTPKATSKKAA